MRWKSSPGMRGDTLKLVRMVGIWSVYREENALWRIAKNPDVDRQGTRDVTAKYAKHAKKSFCSGA